MATRPDEKYELGCVPMSYPRWLSCTALFFCLCTQACNRNVESFVPGEKPRSPDLTKIFPEGAQRAMEREGAMAGVPSSPMGEVAAFESAASQMIRGTITLAPELADRIPQGGVLFLVARGGGTGPPIAAKRISGLRFPIAFELGPEDRMLESVSFAGPLFLSARIDADGNAGSRATGDLQGAASAAVEPGASGIQIYIDQVL